MGRQDMIETAKAAAAKTGEPLDAYWGEPLSVMRVIAACAGYRFHVGSEA